MDLPKGTPKALRGCLANSTVATFDLLDLAPHLCFVGGAAQKVFARAGSRKPCSDQHQECSTTDNHGYRRLDDRRADHDLFRLIAVVVGGNHDAVDATGLSDEAATRPGLRRWRAGLHRDPWFV